MPKSQEQRVGGPTERVGSWSLPVGGRALSCAAFDAVTVVELFSKADALPRMLQKWARWTLTWGDSTTESLTAGACTLNDERLAKDTDHEYKLGSSAPSRICCTVKKDECWAPAAP